MEVTDIKIGLHQFNDSKIKQRILSLRDQYIPQVFYEDENHYLARVIEHQGKHYYQANGITVEAEGYECERAAANPRLYYFSSALKLHFRIAKAKELGMGLNWPSEPAAPLNVCTLEGN